MPYNDWNTDVRNILVAGVAVVAHPFAKGSLTTNGVQYSTELSGGINTLSGYVAVEAVTVKNPVPGGLREIEFDLLGAVHTNSSLANILYKWQGSDDATVWVDLCTAQTTSSTPYSIVRAAGSFSPVSGFLISGVSFAVRMVAAANSGDQVFAKTANSSYITMRFD
jgi:hypothetical protein